jgi:hypothetical protein
VEATTSAMLSIVELHKSEAGGFGMTAIAHQSICSQSVHCANIFFVQITLVCTEVGRAGFITNEFQIRVIERKRIT